MNEILSIKLVILIFYVVSINAFDNGMHPEQSAQARLGGEKYEDAAYWYQSAKDELEAVLDLEPNMNKAKNVIIFVGDGMSLPTLTAARIYRAQKENISKFGEETSLTMETLPYTTLSKTYCADHQTPDSASTAFAMYSGVKTTYYTLGFDSNVVMGYPNQNNLTPLETIYDWAQEAGKDTGFVTTARITHATPAALYGKTPHRDWECDSKTDDKWEYGDLAKQLMTRKPGNRSKVMLGGGRRAFMPEPKDGQTELPTLGFDYDTDDFECWREDGINYIDRFKEERNNVYVNTRESLSKVEVEKTERLLGLFAESHMSYEDAREETKEPSIEEMTETAIRMLQKNKENGFFLMVEGAKIDHAHHGTRAQQSLNEVWAMDRAINKTLEMVDIEETLIIVTADHGHTMSISGYQKRGSDIAGLVIDKDGTPHHASDDKPYLIMSYANGKGYNDHLDVDEAKLTRLDLTDKEDAYKSFEFRYPSSVPKDSETHSGADVGIFAGGPFAHLFTGIKEQNYIAFVMAYSSCIGPYKDSKAEHCIKDSGSERSVSMALSTTIISLLFSNVHKLF